MPNYKLNLWGHKREIPAISVVTRTTSGDNRHHSLRQWTDVQRITSWSMKFSISTASLYGHMVLDDYLKWKIKFVQYLRKLTSTYSFMIMNRLNYSPYSTSYHYSCFILSTIYFLSEFAPSLGFITKHSPEFQSQGQLESVWTVCYNEGIIEARNFQNSSWNFRKSIDFKCVVQRPNFHRL